MMSCNLKTDLDMRNIAQYPITTKEKIEALEAAVEMMSAQAKIGDIRPAALREVLRELVSRDGVDKA